MRHFARLAGAREATSISGMSERLTAISHSDNLKIVQRSYAAVNRRMGLTASVMLAISASAEITEFFKEGDLLYLIDDRRLERFNLRSELRVMMMAANAVQEAA